MIFSTNKLYTAIDLDQNLTYINNQVVRFAASGSKKNTMGKLTWVLSANGATSVISVDRE